MSLSPEAEAPVLLFNGAPLETAKDVADFFGVGYGQLIYILYRAPEKQRYIPFEIPKRTGGMRQILAPVGLIRDMQEKLAPLLAERYDAHPAAHGFIKQKSILTNARMHVGQRLVLNIDLEDFFPTINFGRVRGLFMAPPFGMGPAAASVFAQICTYRNGLPQGAPTSPPLSNFIAATLDRRLQRLAKESGVRYSRYADDITFSTNHNAFSPNIALFTRGEKGDTVAPGEPLERAVNAAGFTINHKKVRLQRRHQRQGVTGLTVNEKPNVPRKAVRHLRAMLHAWEKFGLAAAAQDHFIKHRGLVHLPRDPERAFRQVVYGELSFIKMVRGAEDPLFLNLAAKLLPLDPNPSRFLRQMVFGADDFDVFISHASEDKEEIARPIHAACAKLGLKAFLDEAHIGWGQSFTEKINSALGSARTVLVIITPNSVNKDWPVTEVNTALSLEVSGQKKVVPLMVGKPDLTRLPLIRGKDAMTWANNPDAVAARLKAACAGDAPRRPAATPPPPRTSVPPTEPARAQQPPLNLQRRAPAPQPPPRPKRRRGGTSFWELVFGRRPPR